MRRPETFHNRRETGPGRGYTLVEISVGFLLVSILSVIVMTIYFRGNKATSKGIWRVNSIKNMRNGLRRLKELMEASSYPAVILANNYLELSPGLASGDRTYIMKLGDGASTESTPGSTLTSYTFEDEGEVLTFWACTPREEVAFLGTPVPGFAKKVTLELEPGTVKDNLMQLKLTEETAEVQYSSGSISITDPTSRSVKILSEEITSVGISVTSTQERSLVYVTLSSADPFDGRLKLQQTARALVNVEIEE